MFSFIFFVFSFRCNVWAFLPVHFKNSSPRLHIFFRLFVRQAAYGFFFFFFFFWTWTSTRPYRSRQHMLGRLGLGLVLLLESHAVGYWAVSPKVGPWGARAETIYLKKRSPCKKYKMNNVS